MNNRLRILNGVFLCLITGLALSRCGGIGARPGASVDEIQAKGPVGRTFKKHSDKFTECGKDSVTVQTGSNQKIDLLFTVTAEGKVSKPSVESMSEPDPDLQTCVLRALKKLEFPKPVDGKSKKVAFPLTIRPE